MLDSALLRPGRFDRQVTVDRPDVAGRIQILKVHSRGKVLSKDVDFDKVSRRTPGAPDRARPLQAGLPARDDSKHFEVFTSSSLSMAHSCCCPALLLLGLGAEQIVDAWARAVAAQGSLVLTCRTS